MRAASNGGGSIVVHIMRNYLEQVSMDGVFFLFPFSPPFRQYFIDYHQQGQSYSSLRAADSISTLFRKMWTSERYLISYQNLTCILSRSLRHRDKIHESSVGLSSTIYIPIPALGGNHPSACSGNTLPNQRHSLLRRCLT